MSKSTKSLAKRFAEKSAERNAWITRNSGKAAAQKLATDKAQEPKRGPFYLGQWGV